MIRTRRNRNPRPAALLLILAMLLASTGLLAEPPYAGRPLADALRDLQSRGLDLFFASNVVRPEMRVAAEPASGEPRRVLDELLARHGLAAEEGPGGRLVVVEAEASPCVLRGSVRERRTGRPLGGVRILIPGTSHETTSTADGRFLLPEVEAGSRSLEARRPGFVVEHVAALTLPPREIVEVLIEMDPAPVALDEIVVTPSRASLNQKEPIAAVDLGREDILALPHLGDDIFRALTLLPGVAGEEVSARFNVRGGRTDEVLVLLDRVELYAPYHLKDFSSSVSIITPRALAEVNLITGGFPVQYGDRMSGVLEMNTVLPERRRAHLGASVVSAEAGAAGTFGGDRGHWLGSARRGSLDLALDFLGHDLQPRYWDAFGKMEAQIRPRHRLGVSFLHSDDTLDAFLAEPDTEETYRTSYGNSYLWLTHQSLASSRLFVDSVLSLGRVDRDRRGGEAELEEGGEGEGFALSDRRGFDVAGAKQDWNLQAGERNHLKWGFDVRRLETDFDYFNLRVLEDPLADIRSEPRGGTTSFSGRLSGEQRSVYLSDRLRPVEPLTLELGLRYDEQSLTDEGNLSPRINLVYAPSRTSTLRLAWGYFYQSQRPYELQVEDGETELARAERTEQRVVGFEHAFRAGPGGRGLLLRVEAYQREITNPRVRYENLYEPVTEWPEIEPDRIRVRPERGSSYGAEVFLRGSLGKRIDWWASYAYARVRDRVEDRRVPRRIDQPHTLNLDLNYRAGRRWSLNLAWRYHTGWPTTAVTGRLEEDDDGGIGIVPVFGPLYGARLPDYHRLDLRASREWRWRRGVLGFFVEIQNVYDRGNVAGFDVGFEFEIAPDGEIVLHEVEEIWGGFLPSFGITWEF